MVRVIIGALVSAVAMFIIAFVFYATPLDRLAYAQTDLANIGDLQRTLSANLPRTGTYEIPGVDTPEQTEMYARGPVATIHYNADGFAAVDPAGLVVGLIFYFLVALVIGAALLGVGREVGDAGARMRLVALFALAASALIHLQEPLFYHHDWAHFLYRTLGDFLILAVPGLIIARWFLPVPERVPERVAERVPERGAGPVAARHPNDHPDDRRDPLDRDRLA